MLSFEFNNTYDEVIGLCSLLLNRICHINRYFCSLMLEGKMDALVTLSLWHLLLQFSNSNIVVKSNGKKKI